jgi:DNA processing protein
VSHDLIDRLRLVRSPGIGPVTYRQLIARFGSAAAALEAVPDLAARGGGKPPRLVSQAEAEREIAWIEALGGRYLSIGQALYPRSLAELDDAPRC